VNKRTFLKTSSVIAGGALLAGDISCAPEEKKEHLTNWAGNLRYSTGNVHYPNTIGEVQDVIKKSQKLTALGSRHSFNTIADNTENQVSLSHFNKVVSLDKLAGTVTVESGMKYGELAPYLHENGFALHNLASLPHISIAGAVATATHGSGIKNGNLSTAVLGIEFINAAGELVNLTKKNDGDKFNGAVVALGAFGVVTKLTLELQPTFNMKQVVYRNLAMSELEKNFNEIMGSGYSVSLFTDWKNKNINEVWVKSKVENENDAARPELFGAKLSQQNLHPIETESAENCTDQMGVPGPWYERMPHFKMGFKPSAGKELQAEYFVPIEHAYEAMMVFEKLTEKITPHLFISEIRAIAADGRQSGSADDSAPFVRARFRRGPGVRRDDCRLARRRCAAVRRAGRHARRALRRQTGAARWLEPDSVQPRAARVVRESVGAWPRGRRARHRPCGVDARQAVVSR